MPAVWEALQSDFQTHRSPGTIPRTPYVHPSAKSAARPINLELCTEHLGCETGTLDSSLSLDNIQPAKHRNNKPSTVRSLPHLSRRDKDKHGRIFPPLLTSIIGRSAIRIQPVREGARLLLRTVPALPSQMYLQAQRKDGRLTLVLPPGPSFHSKSHNVTERDVVAGDDSHGGAEVETVRENGRKTGLKGRQQNREEDEGSDERVPDVGERVDAQKSEEIQGLLGIEKDASSDEQEDDDETGLLADKLHRPSRCKEGRHGPRGHISAWEAYLVASS